MARSRSSLSTKIHLACDALGYPLGFIITGANVSNFDQAKPLLQEHLRPGAYAIMDKGYDNDAIRAYVNQLGGVAVIPRKLIVHSNPTLTSISIANAIASKISSLVSRIIDGSPPASKNSIPPSPPCSLSPVSSSGSNSDSYLQTHLKYC